LPKDKQATVMPTSYINSIFIQQSYDIFITQCYWLRNFRHN